MKTGKDNSIETAEANLELNQKLEDSLVSSTADGLQESVAANMKLDDAMNHRNQNDTAPTYLYNNTPAITINKITK